MFSKPSCKTLFGIITLIETNSEFTSKNQGGWKIGVCHNHLRNVPKKMGETRDITKGQTLPVNL